MTKIIKQNQQAFQKFNQVVIKEQASLKKGFRALVRKSAVDAENKMSKREAVEIKNMEEELTR